MRKCHICKEIVGPEHQCFIQKYVCKQDDESGDEEENDKKSQKFIFYDFESTQESEEHQVNFCIAHRCCDKCMHLPVDTYCKTCSELPDHGRETIFEGKDTKLYQFCHWLFQTYNKGSICIAHNFGGYDGQFIFRHILEKGVFKPDLIMNGHTIITMKAGKLKFIYSYQFLHMRLANFPDTFGLTEINKGYFPHLTNTPAYQNYVGPYFPVDMFNPGQMSVKNREAFLTWHQTKVESNTIFDFRKEMERYFRSDVDILRRGCACFRQQLISISGLDPFVEACTVAQVSIRIWRKYHMPENCIAIIPPEVYPNQKKYSIKAVR